MYPGYHFLSYHHLSAQVVAICMTPMQTIYHAQSTVVSDTDTVFEDIDNPIHDLPEDIDKDNARYGGSSWSCRAQQLKLAKGWSSIRDSILDGIVQQAALPPDIVCHLCGKDASVMCCQCGPHAYLCIVC